MRGFARMAGSLATRVGRVFANPRRAPTLAAALSPSESSARWKCGLAPAAGRGQARGRLRRRVGSAPRCRPPRAREARVIAAAICDQRPAVSRVCRRLAPGSVQARDSRDSETASASAGSRRWSLSCLETRRRTPLAWAAAGAQRNRAQGTRVYVTTFCGPAVPLPPPSVVLPPPSWTAFTHNCPQRQCGQGAWAGSGWRHCANSLPTPQNASGPWAAAAAARSRKLRRYVPRDLPVSTTKLAAASAFSSARRR